MRDINLLSIAKLLFRFFIASFMGWLYEITTVYVLYHTYYDRGVLHLPLCPIYGFGILLLSVLLYRFQDIKAIFLGSVIITTILELAASYIIEWKYGLWLWTYEGWPLSFQNRISVISSCIFGVMAVFFMKIINPGIDRIFHSRVRKVITGMVFLLVLVGTFWEWIAWSKLQ